MQSSGSFTDTPRRRSAVLLAVSTALMVALTPMTAAVAQPSEVTLADHGIEDACSATVRAQEPFDDISADSLHGEAVACLWSYGIASGQLVAGEERFHPGNTVTREQMASFIAGLVDHLTDDVYALGEPSDAQLYDDSDEVSDAHLPSVNRLTEAGILRGYGDGTFRPLLPVDRAQMATYIVSAVEEIVDARLPRDAVFDDIADTHQPSIEKLAAMGVATGIAPGTYDPRSPVRRQQMASFLARTLDYLVRADVLVPLAFDPGTQGALLGLVDVEVAAHDGFDRVTFTLDGDDRDAGWRASYVSDARSSGSGDIVDVEGDAILQLSLTGFAYPMDLPDEVEQNLWEENEVTFGGEGIVEVIDDNVYEGRREVFIGTTGRNDFAVVRLDDPQRVYVDIAHSS